MNRYKIRNRPTGIVKRARSRTALQKPQYHKSTQGWREGAANGECTEAYIRAVVDDAAADDFGHGAHDNGAYAGAEEL